MFRYNRSWSIICDCCSKNFKVDDTTFKKVEELVPDWAYITVNRVAQDETTSQKFLLCPNCFNNLNKNFLHEKSII